MKVNLKYTYEANSEKTEQAECLVTGSMSSLQPESMSAVAWLRMIGMITHDWRTHAGLISATWIKNHIMRDWNQQNFSTNFSVSWSPVWLYAGVNMLKVVPLRSGLCITDMEDESSCNSTSHCSGAASGTRTAWSARLTYDAQACPSWGARAVTMPSTLASFMFIFLGTVVNTACQIAKHSSRKRGHTAFERKYSQKVIRRKQLWLKFPRNSQPKEETQHRALTKGLVWKVCEVW